MTTDIYRLTQELRTHEQAAERIKQELARALGLLKDGASRAVTTAKKASPSVSRDDVRRHMKAGTKYTTSQLAKLLGKPQSIVGRVMRKMEDLSKTGKGESATFSLKG